MTVANLWALLETHGCVRTLDGPAALAWLDGKTLALDLSIDLVAGLSVQAASGQSGHGGLACKLLFERVVWLLRYGAHVIGCGDGRPPAEKAATLRALPQPIPRQRPHNLHR